MREEHTPSAPLYTQCDWGDLIKGTKQQLQSLGIGQGMPFPGEPGGNRRRMFVADPRGFATEVKAEADCEFTAYVRFPGRGWKDRQEATCRTYVRDGIKVRHARWCDEYIGSAIALSTAGIVDLDQLPGASGMRKHRVTILADGTIPQCALTANIEGRRDAGAKTITRLGSKFEVCVFISENDGKRRQRDIEAADQEWLKSFDDRPQPLAFSGFAKTSVRSHLRLVWSAPSSTSNYPAPL